MLDALIVLARFPEAGRVKTRLAAAIGSRPAAAVYRAFLEDIRARFGGSAHRWALLWAFEPPDSAFAGEIARGDRAFAQSAGDLGERMAAAIATALVERYRNVVLIGSDIPHLPVETVEKAFACLDAGARLVVGPAEDGGYYLIGASFVPPVFAGVEWGSKDVLEATIARARAAGIEPELMAPLYDVDGPEDLERLGRELDSGRVLGLAATRAALETIRRLG